MSNNIITHLIFFPLHTFLILHIPRSPTTTHFEITSTRFGTTDNNSQQYPPHFLLFAFHLFLQYSLSLSLSLFVVNMCSARRKSRKNKPQLKQTGKTQDARAAKNKPQLKQTDHYKSAYLWASLILSQHNIINLIFFLFSFEQKVSKVNLMFLVYCECLRLLRFILERAFLKSKSLFLNLKQHLSF